MALAVHAVVEAFHREVGAGERGDGMSEFDSRSGNRKGFVRDVMRRISANPDDDGTTSEDVEDVRESARAYRDELEDLQNAIRLFGADSPEFRRRLDRMLAEYEALRRRYQLTREQFSDAERQNEKSGRHAPGGEAADRALKEEVDKLCAPPNSYGIFQRCEQGRHGGDRRRRQARCASTCIRTSIRSSSRKGQHGAC